jgi:predicted GNAT family acetyltransferase
VSAPDPLAESGGRQLRHAPERSSYELLVDGAVVARVDYRRQDDVLVMHHTYTEPAWRGRGLAEQVVRAALDDARDRGLGIRPTCWFVGDFVDAHPEYGALVRNV